MHTNILNIYKLNGSFKHNGLKHEPRLVAIYSIAILLLYGTLTHGIGTYL